MPEVTDDLHYDWFWLLTWTTYGSWLPGDQRGFIGVIHDQDKNAVEHNKRGLPVADSSESLRTFSKGQMKGDELRLALEHARVLLAQFHCTASFRKWRLLAVAIMANHIHLVVNVHGDPEPETILRDFKSYGSRALNVQWNKPASGTWWTQSGSTRKLDSDNSVIAAIQYLCDQEFPLLIWALECGIVFPKPSH